MNATINWADWIAKVHATNDLAALDALEQDLFGRKNGAMTLALKELGPLDPETRKVRGQELNAWKMQLTEALTQKKNALTHASQGKLGETDTIDITMDLPAEERGHLHPIPEFIRNLEEIFGRMGFDVAHGPEVETEAYNFSLLNIPGDHPARDSQDTFWVSSTDGTEKTGDDRLVLRTQTSPVQIRYMQSHKPPFRMICPGKTYRKDSDGTHSPMFHQCEGLMIGKDVSLANMKAVIAEAFRALIGEDVEFRFRSGFFPFVEPGLEIDARWHTEGKESKWLEIAGCGMVHPTVLKNCGIDPTQWQGFAFGCGIERLIMIKNKIGDLRSFYDGDMRFLKQF